MSKCELSISFDDNKLSYEPGDIVKCTVHVSVNKTVNCKQLTIKNFWQTHGRGNRDTGNQSSETLFSGEWEPGEYQYPYSFVVENEPLTYHGKLINIDWYLLARADIPWALDPKAKTEVIVEKKSSAHNAHANVMAIDATSTTAPKKKRILSKIIGITFFLMIASFFFIPNFVPQFPVWTIFASFFGIFIIFIIVFLIKASILNKKLGKVDMFVEPSDLSPAEKCEVEISFTPNQDISVNNVIATLIGKETAVSGSGTNETTHHSALHSHSIVLNQDAMYVAGIEYSEKTSFIIPVDATPSFDSANNHISWSIEIVMDIQSCPDWRQQEHIYIS